MERKQLISVKLREYISLNLSKQIRSKQLKSDYEEKLTEIFGKNVYRLYYDLQTGQQITPTKSKPKLNINVELNDKLKNEISSTLEELGYSILDFNKNIAKNLRNGQETKITKVLTDNDNTLLKNYNQFLTALTKEYKGEDKLYVVISRHSHDIAEMSSKPQITSCENLTPFTDISQTGILNYDSSDIGEGGGKIIIDTIQKGLLVFYLIKEGDWNIQDPISRFLESKVCEFGNAYHFYGEFNNDFKNFITEWISEYSKITNKENIRSDKDLFNKPSEEIIEIIRSNSSNFDEVKFLIRGSVMNKRYDVLKDLISVYNPDNLTFLLINTLGINIFKKLPKDITDQMYDNIQKLMKTELSKMEVIYDIVTKPIQNNTIIKNIEDFIKRNNNSVASVIIKNYEKEINNYKHNPSKITYSQEFKSGVAKIANPTLYNKINNIKQNLEKIGTEKINDKLNQFLKTINSLNK